jgi:hypothetical protein
MHPLTHTGLGHRLTAKRPQTHPRVLEPVIGEWPLLSQRWGNVGCPGLHQPMIKALSNPCFFWEMILKNNPQCSNCIKLPLLKVTTSWYNDTSQGICFCFGGLFSYLFYSIGSVFCGGVQWVTIHEGMTRYPFVLTKRDCMMILCHCWLLWNGKYLHQHKYMCQVRTCPGLPSVGDLTLDAGSSYSSTGDTRAGDARGS